MKKVLVGVMLFLLIWILSGCGLVFDNDDTLANQKMEEIMDTIQEGNKEKIKALFAPSVTIDLDEEIDELQKYYKGSYHQIERVGGPGVSESSSYGKVRKTMNTSYLVVTEVDVYCIAFKWCTRDDFDQQNIGVHYIYILRSIDKPQEYVYWGDGIFSEGIHVGKPHATTYLEKILDCIRDKNEEQLISLFSQTAIATQEDFSSTIRSLFSICDGKYAYSNFRINAFSIDSSKGYDVSYHAVKNGETETGCFCLRWCIESNDPNNLGAWAFYYKKAEGYISIEEPYWGDGNWTYGIHLDS